MSGEPVPHISLSVDIEERVESRLMFLEKVVRVLGKRVEDLEMTVDNLCEGVVLAEPEPEELTPDPWEDLD